MKFIHSPTRLNLGARIGLAMTLLVVGLILALGNAQPALAAPVTGLSCTPGCDLYATTGTLTLADGSTVPIWGYSTSSTPGSATLPGPVLIVNQNDTVAITLHNVNLPSATSLFIPQQVLLPDTTGAAPAGSKTYSFAAGALQPGTYLYEAGLTADGPRQVAMGLYGALIVRPTGAPTQAYANANTAFTDEAVLVLSEIDPAFNAAPATFDMSYFAPKYWLINGKSYPQTAAISADAATATTPATVLLRYVNAGLQHHSMAILGQHQTIIAQDGKPVTNPSAVVADTISAGASLDTLVTVPAGTLAGTKYAILDANTRLDNKGASTGGQINFGGMLTFLTVPGTSTSNGGPVTSNVALSPNPSNGSAVVTLSASISGAPDQAEYFVDTLGVSGAGCQISGSLTSVSVTIPTSGATAPCADLTMLSSANHTFYVHGHDANGWGAFASAALNLDKLGPAVSNLNLTPNPTNGSSDVTVQATGSDVATGNQNVTAAEYNIDGGAPVVITINAPATAVSLNATILAATVNALSQGSHAINIRAQDALGNWGAFGAINLIVDKTGPTTSGVSTTPNPTNGAFGVQVSSGGAFYQRIDATISDVATGNQNVVAAEYLIDTVGANGTGGAMFATAGTFNGANLTVYGAAELYAIAALPQGAHTICVHGKDAAGNWGPCATTTLLVDKTAPTFTSITLAPNPTLGAASVTLTVNGAADTGGAGLAGGEYWINPPTATPPAPGSGIQFTGLTANIPVNTLAVGAYTISARIRDAAGNWSTIGSATLTVAPDAIFANGFETGNSPWGWSSASTNNSTRLNVITSPALVGTRSLQAQGNNTNYVQFNFGTTTNPATATFDARFYFRPNANNSTGKDIFSAATSNTFGTTLFRVRYRLNGTTPQVQIQIGTGNTNATWTNILGGTSNNYIEIVWQSGSSLQLYVNGTLAQTLTTANTGSVGAVRLGSVTNTGANTLMYFDAFSAKRSVSPLLGP
ncbi:MAG: multicopper oxidase domain-containing protein [Caldilineaceae bacterium]